MLGISKTPRSGVTNNSISYHAVFIIGMIFANCKDITWFRDKPTGENLSVLSAFI